MTDKPNNPAAWQPIETAPTDEHVLLNLGESIPDIPYVAVGICCDGPFCENLGYREYAKYGGWLIWHEDGADSYIVDVVTPKAWMSLPEPSA